MEHWAHAIDLGGTIISSSGQFGRNDRAQAVDYLISSNWLIGEAAKYRLTAPQSTVKRAIEERLGPLAHRQGEIETELASMGQTISDVEFEVRAALSAAKLREAIFGLVPAVTQTEIASYYERNRTLFRRERRVVDLIEGLESRAAAIALANGLGGGQRFAQRAVREIVPRPSLWQEEHANNGRLVRAIFAATVGKIAGPASYNGLWVMLIVRRIHPGGVRPLAEVRGDISEYLTESHRRSALAAFMAKYRREWSAKTTCRTELVVPECSEYRGSIESEANPLLDT